MLYSNIKVYNVHKLYKERMKYKIITNVQQREEQENYPHITVTQM